MIDMHCRKKIDFEIGQERAQMNFLIALSLAKGYKRFSVILGCKHPEVILKILGGNFASYFSVSDLTCLYQSIEKRIIVDPKKFYIKLKKRFFSDYKNAKRLVICGNSDANKLLGADKAMAFLLPYIPALRYYEFVALKCLKEILTSRNVVLRSKDLFALTSSHSYVSLMAKEKIDFLRLALDYHANICAPACVTQLRKHAKRYSAYALHGSTKNKIGYENFYKRLNNLMAKPAPEIKKEYDKLKNFPHMVLSEKHAIGKKVCLTPTEKTLLKTLELASEIKARISDSIFATAAISDAVSGIAKAWTIKKEEIYRLSIEEIISSIHSKKIPTRLLKLIKKREKAAIWAKNDKIKIFSGKSADLFLKSRLRAPRSTATTIIGTPIFKGIVRGPVKIIKNANDFLKIERGDIFVCGDFTPDFIVLINKIAAIITNEGGVMSHGAIIAREMGIPCIIGTKNATRALRDGDVVCLNAESGIVTIVERG